MLLSLLFLLNTFNPNYSVLMHSTQPTIVKTWTVQPMKPIATLHYTVGKGIILKPAHKTIVQT